MISDGGDRGGGGGMDVGGGGRDNLSDEVWRPNDTVSDSRRDASDAGLDSAVDQASQITANLTAGVADKYGRLSNDEAAQKQFVQVGTETLQVLGEQNQKAGVAPVAGQMITAAFQAGIDKAMA